MENKLKAAREREMIDKMNGVNPSDHVRLRDIRAFRDEVLMRLSRIENMMKADKALEQTKQELVEVKSE